MIFVPITCTLMASIAMFATVFKTYEKVLQTFLLKRTSQKTFSIPKFVIDTIN